MAQHLPRRLSCIRTWGTPKSSDCREVADALLNEDWLPVDDADTILDLGPDDDMEDDRCMVGSEGDAKDEDDP